MCSGPDAGPSNVTATATNSTEIYLTWGEISKEYQNGVIEEYRILYTAGESFHGEEFVEPHKQDITLENLNIFTEYTISISGRTVAGFGNGTTLVRRTLEEGMKLLHQ